MLSIWSRKAQVQFVKRVFVSFNIRTVVSLQSLSCWVTFILSTNRLVSKARDPDSSRPFSHVNCLRPPGWLDEEKKKRWRMVLLLGLSLVNRWDVIILRYCKSWKAWKYRPWFADQNNCGNCRNSCFLHPVKIIILNDKCGDVLYFSHSCPERVYRDAADLPPVQAVKTHLSLNLISIKTEKKGPNNSLSLFC